MRSFVRTVNPELTLFRNILTILYIYSNFASFNRNTERRLHEEVEQETDMESKMQNPSQLIECVRVPEPLSVINMKGFFNAL